jgi:Ni,Fe-hydrogenase III small subunit/GNAT superfamily N-acetyltransferase
MIPMLKRILKTGIVSVQPMPGPDAHILRVNAELLRILGRALAIRHVDAGSCNGCELEMHALNNPYYNIEGQGIKFVASPRHADVLLVSGVVTKNMVFALKTVLACIPEPKLVIAVGECAAHGHLFGDNGNNYALCGPVGKIIDVDLTIPGCPPTPEALLQGILGAVQRSSRGVTLNPLSRNDFEDLSRLATRIWHAHYRGIISPEQIDYMLGLRFSPEALSVYLDNPKRQWYCLQQAKTRKLMGYCSYAHAGEDAFTLEQLYLDPRHQGAGYGQLMMRHVCAKAHEAGAKRVLLQVNRRNSTAITFYHKAGFSILHTQCKAIGGGYVMDDYVMEKSLYPTLGTQV